MKLGTTKHGHVAIVGRQPAQCHCVWCGKGFYNDQPCLTDEQKAFVRKYARENGRTWKKKLGDEWFAAKGPSESIQLRNQRGPTWLANLKLSKIEEIDELLARRARLVKKIVND